MPLFISDPKHNVKSNIFDDLLAVTHKIGVYWILNYELGIGTNHLDAEVDEENIQIGMVLMINMLPQTAFGKEPKESYFYCELKRKMADSK